MEDIEQFLRQKGAISACFKIEEDRCRMMVAVEDESHLRSIVDEFKQVKKDGSDLCYTFRYVPCLSRGEQISLVQRLLSDRGYTSIIKAEEQEVADVCRRNGAEQVHFISHTDRVLFLIEGEELDGELPDELDEVQEESSRMMLFFAPWFDGVKESAVNEFRQRGEALV